MKKLNEIIKNLVGNPVKLIKYHNDYNHPEALFVPKDDNSGRVVPNLEKGFACTAWGNNMLKKGPRTLFTESAECQIRH